VIPIYITNHFIVLEDFSFYCSEVIGIFFNVIVSNSHWWISCYQCCQTIRWRINVLLSHLKLDMVWKLQF